MLDHARSGSLQQNWSQLLSQQIMGEENFHNIFIQETAEKLHRAVKDGTESEEIQEMITSFQSKCFTKEMLVEYKDLVNEQLCLLMTHMCTPLYTFMYISIIFKCHCDFLYHSLFIVVIFIVYFLYYREEEICYKRQRYVSERISYNG